MISVPGQAPVRVCSFQPAAVAQRWSANAAAAVPSDTGNGTAMHRWARTVVAPALARNGLMNPSQALLQTMQAQGAHEGWYGFAKKPIEWFGSNNWGADDYLSGDENQIAGCVGYFESHDTTADGRTISVRFRKYATPLDGAADLVHEALIRRPSVRAAVETGNLTKVATALRAEHYFVAPAKDYALALWNQAQHLATALGEPLAVALDSDVSAGASGDGSSSAAPLVLAIALGLAWYAFRA